VFPGPSRLAFRLADTLAGALGCAGMVEKLLTEFQVTVFVPTLVSRGRRFRVWEAGRAPQAEGGLYVTADELHETLGLCRYWPPEARVMDPRVMLDTDEPDGETRLEGERREVCHGLKLVFHLAASAVPPPKAWPHRWAVKSVTQVAGD